MSLSNHPSIHPFSVDLKTHRDEQTAVCALKSSALVEGNSRAPLPRPQPSFSSLPWSLCPPLSTLYLAGGEMEEAELTSWRFVSSPFSLDLSKTKQQLIPGVPFLLQVSSGMGRMSSGHWGWWAGRGCVSLTALFPLPLPHLPRPWSVTCQAPQPLAFPSKCLPSCFLDRLLKTRTLNGTQMGVAKSLSPLVFLGPSQKCSSR